MPVHALPEDALLVDGAPLTSSVMSSAFRADREHVRTCVNLGLLRSFLLLVRLLSFIIHSLSLSPPPSNPTSTPILHCSTEWGCSAGRYSCLLLFSQSRWINGLVPIPDFLQHTASLQVLWPFQVAPYGLSSQYYILLSSLLDFVVFESVRHEPCLELVCAHPSVDESASLVQEDDPSPHTSRAYVLHCRSSWNVEIFHEQQTQKAFRSCNRDKALSSDLNTSTRFLIPRSLVESTGLRRTALGIHDLCTR